MDGQSTDSRACSSAIILIIIIYLQLGRRRMTWTDDDDDCLFNICSLIISRAVITCED